MAKRRRKKKNNFIESFTNFMVDAGYYALKVLPLFLILLFGTGIFFGVRSALFADSNLQLQKISVIPNHAVSQTIRQRFEEKYLGENIFQIDLDEFAVELEKDPTIRRADVRRAFPSEIVIELEQRAPIGWVQFAAGGYYGLVSEDGVILDVVKEMDRNLVLIEAFHLRNTDLRTGFKITHEGFYEGILFLKNFWSHEISKKESVSQIVIDKAGNTTITLGGGPDIRLGLYASERLAMFPKVMPLLQSADRRNILYIDLQYDDVIVKRKGK